MSHKYIDNPFKKSYNDVLLWTAGEVGCPIFANEDIFQQPADFLNLTNAYIANAVEAIKKATGWFCWVAFLGTQKFVWLPFTNTINKLKA